MMDSVYSVLMLAMGLAMVIIPGWIAARAVRVHDQQLADRLTRGSDAYFEELRSLQTYRPTKRIWMIRVLGIAFIALALSGLYLNKL